MEICWEKKALIRAFSYSANYCNLELFFFSFPRFLRLFLNELEVNSENWNLTMSFHVLYFNKKKKTFNVTHILCLRVVILKFVVKYSVTYSQQKLLNVPNSFLLALPMLYSPIIKVLWCEVHSCFLFDKLFTKKKTSQFYKKVARF